MKDRAAPRVLFAPLNWGIGHATRSIPLITILLEQGIQVELATCGRAYAVLAEQFPQLPLHRSPLFEVRYGQHAWSTAWHLLQTGIRLSKQVRREQAWLTNGFPEGYFQGLISDNSYGMYIPGIPNVIITHQLELHSGMGSWVDAILNRRVGQLLAPFQEVWIPDFQDEARALAGKRSHPNQMPTIKCRYLGPLSRLTPNTNRDIQTILFLISGPEPQRTLFEQIAHQVADTLEMPVVIVGGNLLGQAVGTNNLETEGKITNDRVYISYANQDKLGELLASASVVVARSGYSSVMDIVRFGKKAVWVPTPGQGEQQYLSKYLSSKYAHFIEARQTAASIQDAIAKLNLVNAPQPIHSKEYEDPILGWCQALKMNEFECNKTR